VSLTSSSGPLGVGARSARGYGAWPRYAKSLRRGVHCGALMAGPARQRGIIAAHAWKDPDRRTYHHR
jgi:hypothetical protein